jgi:hypothetical protein
MVTDDFLIENVGLTKGHVTKLRNLLIKANFAAAVSNEEPTQEHPDVKKLVDHFESITKVFHLHICAELNISRLRKRVACYVAQAIGSPRDASPARPHLKSPGRLSSSLSARPIVRLVDEVPFPSDNSELSSFRFDSQKLLFNEATSLNPTAENKETMPLQVKKRSAFRRIILWLDPQFVFQDFLLHADIPQYYDSFIKAGITTIIQAKQVTDNEMLALGFKRGHICKIRKALTEAAACADPLFQVIFLVCFFLSHQSLKSHM